MFGLTISDEELALVASNYMHLHHVYCSGCFVFIALAGN